MRFDALRITILMLTWSTCVEPTFGQWFNDFKNLTQINAKLDEWSTARPDLITPITIGNSIEGRPIRGLRIAGTGGTSPSRPAVLLNGVQHAREWIAAMTPMYLADQLISRYDTDATVRGLLDEVEVIVLPVVNPDGYAYTWASPANRFWRKNRRVNSNGTIGVDLNRNWSVGWGLNSGSSGNPSSEIYRGPSPFSEPETRALRDFYVANQNIISNIDFHSYSQLILSPWGYTDTQVTPDAALFDLIADRMAASILSVHGEVYDTGPAGSTLYLASGVVIDWVYGDQGAYSYTVELRPQSFDPGFDLPPSEIVPTGEENFPALLDLLRASAQLADGDFNLDDNYNCNDVNALARAILHGSNKAEFDLNGDASLTRADVSQWLVNAGRATLPGAAAYLPGDANLDGRVDGADFAVVYSGLFTQNESWCSGDFNTDGRIDGQDVGIWNEYKFLSAAVPEPAAIGWLGLCAAVLGRRRTAHGVLTAGG
jgi:murein tripeptide amidase MpaA